MVSGESDVKYSTLPQARVKLCEEWIQIVFHILYNFVEVRC